MIQPISKITISDTDTTCIETKKQGMKWKQCSLAHKNYSFISNRQRCKRMWLSARCITQSPPSKLKRENCFSFLGKLQLQQCNGWTEQKKIKNQIKNGRKKTETSLCLWYSSIALVVWLGSECWSQHEQLREQASTSLTMCTVCHVASS